VQSALALVGEIEITILRERQIIHAQETL